MSESDSIDLSQLQNLQFRPDWVEDLSGKETGEVVWGKVSPEVLRRERGQDDGRGRRGPRDDRRGPGGGDRRGPRPGGPGGPRPQGQENRGPRPQGERRGPRPEGPPRGDRPPGDRREFRGGPRGPRPQGQEHHRGPRPPFREGPPPLEGWEARLVADPRSVEAVARQIKASGRAYSVFDVARLFLQDRARFLVRMRVARPRQPQAKGEAPPPPAPEVFQCMADGSLWSGREDAIRHLLSSPALDAFYRTEAVTLDAPKGNFSAVAVCGFSGAILGPPNHHDFQRNVARLHRERFSHMPLDRYKSRIRVEKDEATLARWQESQTSSQQFIPLLPEVPEGGEAPAPLKNAAEMEAHFRANHAAEAVRAVTDVTVPGNIPGRKLSPPLLALLRSEVERQQRFPIQLVQDLCRDLERAGLRFFKKDRKTTFVSRNRPHFLADDVVLGDRVRSIVEMVRANPGITYTRLVSTLAPHIEVRPGEAPAMPSTAPVEEAAEGEVPAAAAVPEAVVAEAVAAVEEVPVVVTEAVEEAPVVEEEAACAVDAVVPVEDPVGATVTDGAVGDVSGEAVAQQAEAVASEAAAEPVAAEAPVAEAPVAAPAVVLSPEEIAILQDLRWLVGEGYVTEFQAGELHVLGRPPVPSAPPRGAAAAQAPAEAGEAAAVVAESVAAADAASEVVEAAAGEAETLVVAPEQSSPADAVSGPGDAAAEESLPQCSLDGTCRMPSVPDATAQEGS
ncbi:MAG: hypothetical protein RLZZ179_2362 [Verrucomicrobiota bacterium]